MRIYLADLGHNQVTYSSDVYPLGVANLAAYAMEKLKSRTPLEIKLFREPQELRAALDAQAPDVVGFSSYSWNHYLSLAFARYAKAKHPGVLTIMGGPNFPLTHAEQESWMRTMPEINAHVRGPTYEGERAFLNLMQRYADLGSRLDGLYEQPVDGSLWIAPNGDMVRGGEVPRIQDLDEIPSPYLLGLMDPFFATGYFPLMQIARGCPFTCQFCNSSVKSNSKVFAHSIENVKADLEYIAKRIKPELPLCLADDNFGMYERDVEIADTIARLQDQYAWPMYIRTTTGKNRPERIIEVMRKIRGALPMTSAVQSMNPQVLKNIKRDNIKLEAYAEIQKEVRAQGMQAYGEMILCLPGESKATFMQGVSDLMDTGVKRISAHQLMLLHGAPLSNPESRQQFGFKTRYRVVARDIGNYTGEPAIELEEMVVETPDFSFQDYLDTRVFHMLLTIFFYEGCVEEAFELAQNFGVKPFAVVVKMQEMLASAPAAFRTVMDEFIAESQQELFPDRETCKQWAIDNMDDLISGKLGGNLLSKYSMMGRFYATHEGLEFLERAIVAVVTEQVGEMGEERTRQLRSVMDYLRGVMLHTPFAPTMRSAPRWTALYDIDAWRAEGYAKPLAEYKLARGKVYATRMEPAKQQALETRIQMFGEHPSGLGKFTRTMFAQDLRRQAALEDAESGAFGGASLVGAGR